MKLSRRSFAILIVILISILAVLASILFVRRLMNRDTIELTFPTSNVNYSQWQLPEGAKARLGKGSINDIKFSPDGNWFAVATTIGIWMYDAKTGTEISLLKGDRQNVKGVMFSVDGSTLIGAVSGGKIVQWDADTGELQTIFFHEKNKYSSVLLSADRPEMVGVSRAQNKIVHLRFNERSAPKPIEIKSINFDFEDTHSPVIGLSPDGRFLALAVSKHRSKRKTPIHLWDTSNSKLLFTLSGHERSIQSLAFSPDSKTLASGDNFRTIKLWNMNTQESQISFKAPISFSALAFSPNGKTLVSGGHDGSIYLWDATAKQQGWLGKIGRFFPKQRLTRHKYTISDITYSPDGNRLLTGSRDGTIRVWDANTGRQQLACSGHASEVVNLAISEENNALKTGHFMNYQIQNWDTNVGHHLTGTFFNWKSPLAISSDAKYVVIKDWSPENTYELWDTSEKRKRLTITGIEVPPYKIPTFVFSNVGNRLATATQDEQICKLHIWNIPIQTKPILKRLLTNVKTIAPVYTLNSSTGSLSTLALSPNGDLLASGGEDKIIHLWDIEKGTKRLTLTGQKNEIRRLVFSPSGKTLASMGYDEIYIWDVISGERISSGRTNEVCRCLRFSPDETSIVSGGSNGTIQVRETRTFNVSKILKGHTDLVNDLAFFPDGKTLATASRDGTVILWDWEYIKQKLNP